MKRILLSTNSLFKTEDTALDLALAWTQQDLSIRASIFPALLGKRQLLSSNSLFKAEDTALDLALSWTQQDLSTRASIFPALLGKLTTSLKVPKREIFDRSDFPDFYTIKSSWVGDLLVKILIYYFNF